MESLVDSRSGLARHTPKHIDLQEILPADSAAKLRIGIFGICYVGSVSAACLARDGHEVVAIDVNENKVDILNRGLSPIVEPRLGESILSGVRAGRLTATTDAVEAVLSTDISFVCVGTPSQENGSLETSFACRVAQQIGESLRESSHFHSVVVRSTM